jgi:hypothetical protein
VKHEASAVADDFKKEPAGHASEVGPGAGAESLVDLDEEHDEEESKV